MKLLGLKNLLRCGLGSKVQGLGFRVQVSGWGLVVSTTILGSKLHVLVLRQHVEDNAS